MSTSYAVDQLGSLIQLVSSQMDPANSVSETEKLEWLKSALKGKRNLLQYLMKKIVMDKERSKNEHRLSLLLLALIARMATNLSSGRSAVIDDLTSVEGFWNHIISLISLRNEDISLSIRCNALSLLVNAYRINGETGDWPTQIFSVQVMQGVINIMQGGSSSLTSRLMLVSLEYFLLAYKQRPRRVREMIKLAPIGIVTSLVEQGGQLLVCRKYFAFDPIIEELDMKLLRLFMNELIDIGGNRIYTPLALLCIETTPPLSPKNI